MSVPTVSGDSSGSTPVTSASGPRELGKQDFLLLLIAQLQNQDPLRPMDDTQFIAQLAQFNSLEQMQQLNQTLSGLAELSALSQAASFIGKQVTANDPASQSTVQGIVTDVTIVDGTPQLTVAGQPVDLRDVIAIGAAEAAPPQGTA